MTFFVTGTNGNDTLVAFAADISIRGLDGDDELFTEFTETTIQAGTGNDVVTAVVATDAVDAITSVSGGAGIDSILVEQVTTNASALASIFGGDGNDDIALVQDVIATADFANVLATASLTGEQGDDVITANAGVVLEGATSFGGLNTAVDGRVGDDQILVLQSVAALGESATTEAIASVKAGDGNDIVDLAAFSEIYGANSFAVVNNVVTGDNGNDEIVVNSSIFVGDDAAGSAAITESSVLGGTGADKVTVLAFVESAIESSSIINVFADGGAGNDEVFVQAEAVSGADAFIDVFVNGAGGVDAITIDAVGAGGASSIVTVSADAGSERDQFVASLKAQQGLAVVNGGSGSDSIAVSIEGQGAGAIGTIVVAGGNHSDTVLGTLGADVTGNSSLFGEDGKDFLTVVGGQGNVLSGGSGDDVLTGGAFADFFVFGAEGDPAELANGFRERDTIVNYSLAEGDAIDLTNGIADISGYTISGGNTRLTLVGDGDVIVLNNLIVSNLATDLLIV